MWRKLSFSTFGWYSFPFQCFCMKYNVIDQNRDIFMRFTYWRSNVHSKAVFLMTTNLLVFISTFFRLFVAFAAKGCRKHIFCLFYFDLLLLLRFCLKYCFIISDCKQKEIHAISKGFLFMLKLVTLLWVLAF